MLSDNIRTLRKNRGFTQEDLANRLNVTRQTISKWEKGISVPDAEMLSKLAEELETNVGELLGAKIEIPSEENAVVEQLSRLNEQLAIKNRRARRIWKTLAAIGIVFVVIPLFIAVFGLIVFNYSGHGVHEQAGSTHYEYQDGEYTYSIDIAYDSRYKLVAFGIDSPDPETDKSESGQFSTETYDYLNSLADMTDARKLDKELKEYAEKHRGVVIVTAHEGLKL